VQVRQILALKFQEPECFQVKAVNGEGRPDAAQIDVRSLARAVQLSR